MDGLEKDLALANALSTSSADWLRQDGAAVHSPQHPNKINVVDEKEKTLAGVVIGDTWDLIAGKAQTSQARVDRAQKADQYAEIAADTFASIPKFKALTGGIARSVLLIDVSGQHSAGDVVKGMAFNFLQGMAFNGVGRMAGGESAVGKLITSRLGAGISAEVVTQGISGGGFGLVNSGLSEHSWIDARGNFSLSTGLKNVATGTSVGTLIGIPAGMAGLRVGRAVTLGLGRQVESSVIAGTVQKFATGAGSGFASGSVFGGVDAAKSGKSITQILDSSFQGGIIGLVTGGVSAGFDHTPVRDATGMDGRTQAAPPMGAALVKAAPVEAVSMKAGLVEDASVEAASMKAGLLEDATMKAATMKAASMKAASMKAATMKAASMKAPPMEVALVEAATMKAALVKAAPAEAASVQTRSAQTGAKDYARDIGQLSLTEKMLELSNSLETPEARHQAFDRLSYKPQPQIKIEAFYRRLKPPVFEDRSLPTLKANAPKNFDEYQTALKGLKAENEPLDYTKHFWQPFAEWTTTPMRIYGVEGHSTKIVVPESYAKQLDEVRTLRKVNESPSAYDTLDLKQKMAVSAAMKKGDASSLDQFMTTKEITQYIKVFQAGAALQNHPLGNRALPEDLVPILDALANRKLLKEVHLLDTQHFADLHKSMLYDAPGFVSAATVGTDSRVSLHQAKYGSTLYNTIFHEWSHVAKWQSPAFSKMFDLASIVDHADTNIDHRATVLARVDDPTHESVISEGLYYPDLHSTHSQDENFAVGLGEEMLGPDPTKLFTYINRAPVRAMTLAKALENNLVVSSGATESSMVANMLDRAQYASQVARPWAIGTLQQKLTEGTPVQKAAAVHLMANFGTAEQGADLLQIAADKTNNVVPNWDGSVAEEHMTNDSRTVAQHAFDSYLSLVYKGDRVRFDQAMALMVQNPELQDVATSYIERSSDPRLRTYGPFVKMYNPQGTPMQRAAGVELIKEFGGEHKADMLLSIALQKDNDQLAGLEDTAIRGSFTARKGTVSQLAYDAYVEASASSPDERYQFALNKGLEKPTQRDLASQYLLKRSDRIAQGYGKFLEMYSLPGHVAKMQELIADNFRHDIASQKMVFDRMMQLTDTAPRRQMELINKNLHTVPALIDSALNKMDGILNQGTTRQQREEIDYAITQRMHWENYSQRQDTHMQELLARVNQENKIQDALAVMQRGHGNRVQAVHELSILHDQRAIKPLLQQAVSGNGVVEQEAIGALSQFSPALVKYYAQELKRECFTNPVMTGKITALMSSHHWALPEVSGAQ